MLVVADVLLPGLIGSCVSVASVVAHATLDVPEPVHVGAFPLVVAQRMSTPLAVVPLAPLAESLTVPLPPAVFWMTLGSALKLPPVTPGVLSVNV